MSIHPRPGAPELDDPVTQFREKSLSGVAEGVAAVTAALGLRARVRTEHHRA